MSDPDVQGNAPAKKKTAAAKKKAAAKKQAATPAPEPTPTPAPEPTMKVVTASGTNLGTRSTVPQVGVGMADTVESHYDDDGVDRTGAFHSTKDGILKIDNSLTGPPVPQPADESMRAKSASGTNMGTRSSVPQVGLGMVDTLGVDDPGPAGPEGQDGADNSAVPVEPAAESAPAPASGLQLPAQANRAKLRARCKTGTVVLLTDGRTRYLDIPYKPTGRQIALGRWGTSLVAIINEHPHLLEESEA